MKPDVGSKANQKLLGNELKKLEDILPNWKCWKCCLAKPHPGGLCLE